MKALKSMLSEGRFAYKTITLSVLAAATCLCSSAAAQACAAAGNAGIIPVQGQTLCIDPGGSSGFPVQPPIVLQDFDDNGCDSFEYTLGINFTEQNSRYEFFGAGFPTTAGIYVSDVLPTNVPWIVDWSENEASGIQGGGLPNFYEGGEAYSYDFVNNDTIDNYTSFWIAGENPSLGPSGQVAQAAQGLGAPWWLGHALAIESSTPQFPAGSQQFIGGPNSVGTSVNGYYGAPVFGYPDGFGIGQVDGKANPLSDDDIWSWEQNLYDGIGIANAFQSPAASYWNSQLQQIQSLAAANGVPVSNYYPNTFSSTYCTFSPTGSGNNGYGNGFWITAYNTGTANFNNNGFASVDPSTGAWIYNWSYATALCNRASNTMPQ